MSNPFQFINAINTTKENLMHETENDALAEKSYSPFLTNRALSYHADTIHAANQMNQCYHIDNKLQFEFLLNIIRKRNRYSKWEKKDKSADLEIIKEYYGYSDAKAINALSVLTKEQVKTIRKKLEKGGKHA